MSERTEQRPLFEAPASPHEAKPFVKWVGGKRKLVPLFRQMGVFPPSGFDPNGGTYFEPFLGGGAAFFALIPPKASLFDMNAELINAYTVVRDDVEALIRELTGGYYVYAKDRYLEIRSAPKHRTLSSLEAAARFIYLNRTGFNGLYRVNRKGEFNVPFGRYANPQICDEDGLRSSSAALRGADLQRTSYQAVLDRAVAGDFVYFDPPYYPVSATASFTSYTSDVFMEREQEELRDVYRTLAQRGCYVLLSNSYTPFIRELYEPLRTEGITVHSIEAARAINSNASKRGKVPEALVANYE
ncbi:MAG: DNA adenine methylase [Trueperaceae bacterium]|nr:DNA adenine methylase [Trueperaceae bacterium]